MSRRPSLPVPFVLFAAITMAACSDTPTQPADATAGTTTTFVLPPDESGAFAAALDDARLRVLPALVDIPGSAALRRAMDDAAAAFELQEGVALVNALTRVARTLDAVAAADEAAASAPDLEAVRLIVAASATLLDRGAEAKAR